MLGHLSQKHGDMTEESRDAALVETFRIEWRERVP